MLTTLKIKTVDVKINIDIFFVDRSNNESQARFEKLKQKFPNLQKTRYLKVGSYYQSLYQSC
jgi:hypothetical protein